MHHESQPFIINVLGEADGYSDEMISSQDLQIFVSLFESNEECVLLIVEFSSFSNINLVHTIN